MSNLRLLVLNWRDPEHPRAGGAEFYTHAMARRWVAAGDQVEWFSAGYPGGAAEQELDGVRVVRQGRQWTVHARAMARYRGRLAGRFDAVIDEVNTIPFFTPLWADVPSFMLIYQLAREVWWYESRFPLSLAGYLAEPLYLHAYRRSEVFTFAESTCQDLRALGFRGQITVGQIGVESIDAPKPGERPSPAFLYVGRLAPSKRVDHVVDAFARFRARAPAGELWLVGSGAERYISALRRQVQRLGLQADVKFLGRLDPEAKHRRMADATALVMASVREGWGLVVTEAGACGTPTIAYDVPGLRDSIRDQQTGLLVRPNPEALASAMSWLADDPALRTRLGEEARVWSASLTCDVGARVLRDRMLTVLGR